MFKVIFISLYPFSNKDSEIIKWKYLLQYLDWKVTAECNNYINKSKITKITVINN